MRQHRGRRSGVEDRWIKADGTPSACYGKGKRWRARYVDSNGVEGSKSFKAKPSARAWLDDQTSAVTTGTHVRLGAGRMVIGELTGTYLINASAHLKPKSLESVRSIIDSRILPSWETTEVGRITTSGVQAFVASLVAGGLSPSRVRQTFHTLQAVLAIAVTDREIAVNPCAGVKLPKLVTGKPHRYLTMRELLDLAGHCGEHGDIVLTLGLCGLRWGELAALQVDSVDFLRRRLAVDRSIVEVGGKLVHGVPKSSQRRETPIPRNLLDALAARCVGKAPTDLLFTSGTGAVLRSRNFRRDVYDMAAVKAGVPGLDLHSLRHTSASLAIHQGASALAVARMLGHADPSVTMRIYAHLFDDQLDTVADALADAAADALRTEQVPRSATRGLHTA